MQPSLSMRLSMCRRVVLACCVWPVCVWPILTTSSVALELNAAALQALKTGEPVMAFTPDPVEKAAGLVEAVIDIPAAPDKVWRLLTDCELNLQVFNGLKSCRIVSADADTKSDVREHTISWSRLLPTMRSVFKSQYDAPKEIRFTRVDGDLKQLQGAWRLEALPAGGGTRLHYAANIAVGLPVPAALIRTALESDMPKTLKAIRKAASNGV
jgi:carbon monoxide dehydrogenase subunit G